MVRALPIYGPYSIIIESRVCLPDGHLTRIPHAAVKRKRDPSWSFWTFSKTSKTNCENLVAFPWGKNLLYISTNSDLWSFSRIKSFHFQGIVINNTQCTFKLRFSFWCTRKLRFFGNYPQLNCTLSVIFFMTGVNLFSSPFSFPVGQSLINPACHFSISSRLNLVLSLWMVPFWIKNVTFWSLLGLSGLE